MAKKRHSKAPDIALQRNWGGITLALTAVLLALGGIAYWRITPRPGGPAPSKHDAPDVILVTIDTLRADSVGYAGNSQVSTPFLDGIASHGVVFTNAHAHNVVTLPSHTNILTGLYPYQHGVRDNAGFRLDRSHLTIASRLRELGYTTGAFVGAFPLDRRFGLDQGFDVYDDNYGKGETRAQFIVQERPASAVLAAATTWWESQKGRKRFLWIHLYDPHAPYQPTGVFAQRYASRPYLGEIAQTDDSLGRSLAPILANSSSVFLIVTGDHGEALGDHGELTHGLFAYEATLHVPLLLYDKRFASHRVDSSYVGHVDIVPTILERVGAAVPKDLPGESLLGSGARHDTYFEALSASLNRGWAPLRGILRDGRKYIDLPIPELYDLPADPGERLNIIDKDRRISAELRKVLGEETARSVRGVVSSEEKARLMALGYVGGSSFKTRFTTEDDPKRLLDMDNRLHQVVALFEGKNLKAARTIAESIVRERPQMSAGRDLLAFIDEQSGDVAGAVANLEACVANGSASPDMRARLALLWSESGHPDRALPLLEPLEASGDPDTLNAIGVVLSDLGRNDEAMGRFRRVIATDPNNAPAYQNIGIVLLREGKKDEAKASLKRSLALNPRLPLALNALGVVYAQENDPRAAIESWKQVIALDPSQFDALYNLALVESQAGLHDDARRHLEDFVRRAPQSRYAKDIRSAKNALRGLK
ncbi:MAG TPA: sulfatase-like hydrolase/transferase [Thermoanaerobaculia bacterium]|nr:sulfatase-like hydrolase/transferase [Thermoanaerobaculia bacterium]